MTGLKKRKLKKKKKTGTSEMCEKVNATFQKIQERKKSRQDLKSIACRRQRARGDTKKIRPVKSKWTFKGDDGKKQTPRELGRGVSPRLDQQPST